MPWLLLFVGVWTGALFMLSGFQNIGLGTLCGLFFVAAAIYEVDFAVRHLAERPSGKSRPKILPAKFYQLAEHLDGEE